MKNTITFIALVLLSFTSYSQEKGAENIVGTNHIIDSEILKEKKNIQVYLPKNYADSNKNYPVIYLLDGQRFFLYGASLYQSFSEFNLTPDFIIVGITNEQSKRMRTFSAGTKDFADYLEKEVISLIDKTYRTSNKRLLFGWAYGGGFAIEMFISKPKLFDGYILSSPFPVSGKMKRFKSFLEQNKELNTFVYFVSDVEEFGVKNGTEELSSFLNENTTNLRWKFKVLSGEEHRSTVYPALYHGLNDYFEYYKELPISNLENFNKQGGISYVNAYYKKRSELYNIQNEMSLFTKYNLTRLAIRSNNFTQFEAFIKEFQENKFIGSLRVNRACTIVDFYIKNDKKQKALSFYRFLATKHPKSMRVYNGLGNLYKSIGNQKKADEAYKKVADLKTE
jgi:predicted alpha/beta superfamily hydrolase